MIRPAKETEHQNLTSISFASKRYWNYPDEYFDIWKNELTISREYIQSNSVFVYQEKETLTGYYSIVELKADMEVSGILIHKGFWLEHMFIMPRSIGRGIGSKMFKHIQNWCRAKGIFELGILADPNSRGFYEKMGCEYQKEFPSTIPKRTTPCLIFKAL